MAAMSLPPGFRFHPTDEELVAYYLDRKITGKTIELEIIPEVDLYKCEPWDLPEKSFLPSKDMEWYFYSPRDKKYPNGSRTNRATKAGYWKATGKDRAVHSQNRPVGMKKTLVYYRGRAPHGIRTNWVMHEYRLTHHSFCAPASISSSFKDSYALCRVFKKTMQIPKSKQGKNDAENEDDNYCNDENLNINDYSKFPISDTSSSDVTQGTPMETALADDSQAPFTSDEANSSANMYSMGLDFASNLLQDMEIPSLHSYQIAYPPLEIDDFPQINIAETMPAAKSEIHITEDYCINATLDDIFSLCSSHDNSVAQDSVIH
ncbi:hypothetical protein JCGZ_08577 [Jatropha curcas]|uniref:NAC transcription factor 046 n=1 Tax=Jatropha curcas TaxID=180498 RepID=R4N5P8_JATCU|nr:NAC domain-containing protein 71 [Jatropha curcas]AGL39702.1 NAC transcription factor 046 [Jatropha curcas]KDP36447.1 hypothetical protein JCGZ_08577 [Jatropha curcas]